MSQYVDASGVITFWIAGSGVSRARLREVLAREGVSHSVPRARQPLSALKRAVHEAVDEGLWPVGRRERLLVRPLPTRRGYALVRESADDSDPDRLSHGQVGSVELVVDPLTKLPALARSGLDSPFRARVRELFATYQDLLSRPALSDFLTSFLTQEFGATSLRPSGGLYQFREGLYDAWLAWADLVDGCTVPGRKGPLVYTLRHAMDEQAARAVLDGVRREITARARELTEEVSGTRLGARGKAARAAEARRLLAKVESVEGLLNEALPDLKDKLSHVAALAGGLEILAAVEAASA